MRKVCIVVGAEQAVVEVGNHGAGRVRLSEREVEKIRKRVVDKDREERRSNIIKKVKIPKDLEKN